MQNENSRPLVLKAGGEMLFKILKCNTFIFENIFLLQNVVGATVTQKYEHKLTNYKKIIKFYKNNTNKVNTLLIINTNMIF